MLRMVAFKLTLYSSLSFHISLLDLLPSRNVSGDGRTFFRRRTFFYFLSFSLRDDGGDDHFFSSLND